MDKIRCEWVDLKDTLMVKYHDEEYGTKKSGLNIYFEALVLDSFQAGLSWRCILHKREAFRDSFYNFDPVRVANMDESDVLKLLENKSIVRHRGKIEATIKNAKAVLLIESKQGFKNYIDGFKSPYELSKSLKKLGFSYVGETTCHEIMASLGLIPVHEESCFRYVK
jgi:DNA-3-methyladenine glycosylase I